MQQVTTIVLMINNASYDVHVGFFFFNIKLEDIDLQINYKVQA